MNVLISLYKGYGLGDAVQMSAVLRHVAKYRPEWTVDYLAETGKHEVGRGIVNGKTLAYGEQPEGDGRYNAEVQIILYDTWANWHDRPNTRVSSALHERFGLAWDAECGRYRVDVPDWAMQRARQHSLLYLTGGNRGVKSRSIALHYQGVSSKPRKDLTDEQAMAIGRHIQAVGYDPLILDYHGSSPIREYGRATNPDWGKSAVMQCAVIRQCSAFIWIDSGPSKCASSTDTPSLVIWTGHHPAPFHDPAPNTTHLVPEGYHGLNPVCNNPDVIKWFEAHHRVMQYKGDPVYKVREWLEESLK